MPARFIPARFNSPRIRKTAAAGLATAGAAAIALTAVPAGSDSQRPAVSAQNERVAAWDVSADDVPGQRQAVTLQQEAAERAAKAQEEQDEEQGEQAVAPESEAETESRAVEERTPGEVGSRSAERVAVPEAEPAQQPAQAEAEETEEAAETYPDNLDGWIREALSIMADRGIPGTYEGLHRNIIRESSGDPNAVNDWDINAINGTPSIGLLQVIQPTFDAYHVEGTPYDLYDPVANIVAAANYAWDRYGSIDNVNGPY